MVLIQVKRKKDVASVFEILLKNGKFTGLPNRKFIIQENSKETIKKIQNENIDIIVK